MKSQKKQNEIGEQTHVDVQRLVVEVGNEHFEPGLTRLELGKDGHVMVLNRFEGKEPRYESRVEEPYAARLLTQAGSKALLSAPLGKRQGLPDEPLYHIALYRGQERIHTIRVWRSELPSQPELADLINALQTIVQQASNGQAIL